MNAIVLKNNTVVNIIVADPSVYAELGVALGASVISAEGIDAQIGWMTEDGGATFHAPDEPYAIIDALTGEEDANG